MAIVDIKTEITGNVWKIVASPNDHIAEDDPILILESMKMEIPVEAPVAGVLSELKVGEEDRISEGDVIGLVGNTGLTGLGAALLALGWLRRLYRGRELLYARDLKPGDAIRIRLLDSDDEVTIEG